jgi:hypothetical protein
MDKRKVQLHLYLNIQTNFGAYVPIRGCNMNLSLFNASR